MLERASPEVTTVSITIDFSGSFSDKIVGAPPVSASTKLVEVLTSPSTI